MQRKLLAVVCCAMIAMCIQASSADAQAISIGPGGVQVRSVQGSVDVNSRGVRVYDKRNARRPYVRSRTTVRQSAPRQSVRIDRGGVTVQQRDSAASTSLLVVTNTAAVNYQRESELAMTRGDYTEASASVAEAIQRDPSNAQLHLFASHVYCAAGQYGKASYELELATNTMPMNEWSFVYRNRDRMGGRSRYSAQHQSLVRHLNANPSDHDIRALYAFHMWLQGDLRASMQHNELVLRSSPRHRLAVRFNDAWTAATVRVEGDGHEVVVTDRYSDVRVNSDGSIVDIHSGPDSGVRVNDGTSDEVRIDNGGITVGSGPDRVRVIGGENGGINVNPGHVDGVKVDNGGITIGNGLLIDF